MRPDVIRALVEGTTPRIGNRITLVFCASVKHAEALADAYNAAGIRSAAIYGDMSRDELAHILRDWRTGAIQLVTNDALLIEGFDFPEIAALVLARPTASLVRYVQQIGRGTRTAPGKDDALILEATPGKPDMRQVTLGDVDPTFADGLPHGRPRRPKIILLDPRQDGRFRFFSVEEHGCYVAPISGMLAQMAMRYRCSMMSRCRSMPRTAPRLTISRCAPTSDLRSAISGGTISLPHKGSFNSSHGERPATMTHP
jgi:hypothetical protein